MLDPAGVQDRHPSFPTPKKFLILERLARIYDLILMGCMHAYVVDERMVRRDSRGTKRVAKKTTVEEKSVSVVLFVCPRVRLNYYFSFVSL